jgi:hypothetical protein
MPDDRILESLSQQLSWRHFVEPLPVKATRRTPAKSPDSLLPLMSGQSLPWGHGTPTPLNTLKSL